MSRFKPLKLTRMPSAEPKEVERIVYLYRAPDCIRGWLSYVTKPDNGVCSVTVKVMALDGPKAKNKAITLANAGFKDLEIIDVNYDDSVWGLDNYPDIKEIVDANYDTNS
jgi:hypothetical protein